MELKVDLKNTIFKSSGIIFDKTLNFIYGRNGSGKSTLTRLIQKQHPDDYNIKIFNGSEEISNNEYLDAIALGEENKQILAELKTIDKNITDMTKEITLKDGVVNIASDLEEAQRSYKEQQKTIEDFYTNSARKIRNHTPKISSTNYDKNSFQEDIKNAKILSEEDRKKHLAILRATKKDALRPHVFPEINTQALLKATIDIINTIESPSKAIKEINSQEKQSFAREGFKIHEHKQGEICAFCGNEISLNRWNDLDSFFSKNIDKLELRINNGIDTLNDAIEDVKNIKALEASDFYEYYFEEIQSINGEIEIKKQEILAFLNTLNAVLKTKQKNIFKIPDDISEAIAPDNFSDIKNKCNTLIDKNNKMSSNLSNKQTDSALLLRLDMAKTILQEFEYETKINELERRNSILAEKNEIMSEKKLEIEGEKIKKSKLIEQMKDEKKVARKINDCLASIGSKSFKIEHIEDPDGKKGQYRVRGNDNLIRPINQLSKGELNIVYFLYFIYSLDNSDKTKPTIVIFDDPMSSNDDTMQYLMISELSRFYNNFKSSQQKGLILMMTHNCQFFLNSRPSKVGLRHDDEEFIKFYQKNAYYHFLSNGKKTDILKITTEEEDFSNSYELLWQELRFLYEKNKPTLMLNPARKICETYCNFNSINSNTFYTNNSAARKLFNTNQHAPYDLDAEQNGKTKEEIINLLEDVFSNNNAINHFNNNWKVI
ncbi:AAA family ATPase [Candidatus Saccharibacteria bacterium]|nr:AAA family ATPase [Candidatus Saccharibacteria bacterium]